MQQLRLFGKRIYDGYKVECVLISDEKFLGSEELPLSIAFDYLSNGLGIVDVTCSFNVKEMLWKFQKIDN